MTTDSLNYTLGDTCLTESDDGELEDGAQDPKPEDLLKVIEQKFAVFILKLENCFHVPRAAVDDLNNLLSKMNTSAVLRFIIGEMGIPDSVEELKSEIKRQCEVSGDFRLQYKDNDFDEFINLTYTSDIENKATIKLIYLHSALSTCSPCSSLMASCQDEITSMSSVDTDILSSSESSSSSFLRCEPWPDVFPVPEFVYDVEIQLQRANSDFESNDTFFSPSPRMKSDILECLASQILKYKAYPSSAEFDAVAEALVNGTIETRRACVLKALMVYLNEDPENLI
ncbi:hypothetical protein F2P81_025262 [Scophthalmus maximus]|uniref:Uncharacterized protein n=1 Tax=Scophthalmus maximus TaxID=52904 RepID=A0A6A4RQ84_SCOMX|nr:hypothetical protein F2P81_025262 [Scophthalmus maximus]